MLLNLSLQVFLPSSEPALIFVLAGHPEFSEPQQPAGYTQVSAEAMLPPGPPSWASENHKPAPPASGQTPAPVPGDMANIASPFTVQQNLPPGSATPSLSSCSTVRMRREGEFEWLNVKLKELIS